MTSATSLYSLWLEPPGGALLSKTSGFIKQSASHSGARCPLFEPHVTLAGGFVGTEDEARALCTSVVTTLASTTGYLRCDAVEVTCGDRYHQCVYIAMKPTYELLKAHELAAVAFGVAPGNGNGTPYMPHLSLVYGDLTSSERRVLANEAKHTLFGDTQHDVTSVGSFRVDKVSLWRTDAADLSCASWKRVEIYPLRRMPA